MALSHCFALPHLAYTSFASIRVMFHVCTRPAHLVLHTSCHLPVLNTRRISTGLLVSVTCVFLLQDVMNQSSNTHYESPRPPSRGGNTEARENAEKGRGLMSLVLDNSHTNGLASPRSPSRLSSREAMENAQRGRGTMSLVMDSSRSQCGTPRPSSRLRADGQRIAARSNGSVASIMCNGSPDGQDALARVRPEARDNYERNRGVTTNLFNNYGKMALSSRPAPRVRPEAEECATRNKGTMQSILHSYGKQPLSARPMPRVKPEAHKNAMVGRGTMAGILGQKSPVTGTPR